MRPNKLQALSFSDDDKRDMGKAIVIGASVAILTSLVNFGIEEAKEFLKRRRSK